MAKNKKQANGDAGSYAAQAAAIRAQAKKHKDPKVRAAINAQAAIVEKLGKGAPAK